jgi:hypothetical protein
MDEATYRHLIDDHARFPTVLLNIFQGSDEGLLRERASDERWSPLEILAHLRDEEVEDFGDRARAAVEGRKIELNVDPERWVVERKYNEMDPGAVYLDFARLRADSCLWLSDLGLADLEKTIEHRALGEMRAGDFIAAWRVHDLLHLRQFATTMAVLTTRRLEGWKVQYAGTIPVVGTTGG